jgi:kynurenine formamidase
MRIRSFIIAYALVLAILLFADRRPGSPQQDRYSHVVDLTVVDLTHVNLTKAQSTNSAPISPATTSTESAAAESTTRIISPGALIPGTWSAGQIPPERLIAPLVVIDLKTDDLNTRDLNAKNANTKTLNADSSAQSSSQVSLDDIAAWESHHGMIPQGSVVAIRRGDTPRDIASTPLPITHDAAQFLIDARYTIGFAVETHVDFSSDRTLARQIALRGAYVVEQAAPFTSLPATGSLVIVAPTKAAPRKTQGPGDAPVRILAMVH